MSRNVGRVALCGVLAGFSVVIMLLTYIAPFMTYALPMVAGALLLVPSIEYGTPTALTMYVSVSALSAIIVGDKEAAAFYIILFGIYPILKKYFEKIKITALEYITKFFYFNAVVIAFYFAAVYLLSMPFEDSDLLGKYAPLIVLAVGNFAFIIYDICLTRCATLYVMKIQPRITKIFNINK